MTPPGGGLKYIKKLRGFQPGAFLLFEYLVLFHMFKTIKPLCSKRHSEFQLPRPAIL